MFCAALAVVAVCLPEGAFAQDMNVNGNLKVEGFLDVGNGGPGDYAQIRGDVELLDGTTYFDLYANKIYADGSELDNVDADTLDSLDSSQLMRSAGAVTDNRIARFDGTTGRLLQPSNLSIDDSGNLQMQYASITNAGSINASSVSAGHLSGSSAGIGSLSVHSDVSVSGTASFYGSIYGQLKPGDGSASAPAYAFSNDTNTGMYRIGSDYLGFTANGHASFAVRPDSVQTDGYVILYAHHATPAFYPDQSQIYTQGTGTGTNIYVMDAAGNDTCISPHAFDLYTPAADDPAPWTYNSQNSLTGKKVNADMSGALRALEELTGRQFLYYADLPAEEIVDLETWQTSATLRYYERAVQKIIAADPWVEIPLAEALEEVEETEVQQVEETVTRYRIDFESAVTEPYEATVLVEREVPTGRMTRRLREGVRFDEETGVCTRRRTFEDVDLATIEPPDLTLPAYVMDRLPAARVSAAFKPSVAGDVAQAVSPTPVPSLSEVAALLAKSASLKGGQAQ